MKDVSRPANHLVSRTGGHGGSPLHDGFFFNPANLIVRLPNFLIIELFILVYNLKGIVSEN